MVIFHSYVKLPEGNPIKLNSDKFCYDPSMFYLETTCLKNESRLCIFKKYSHPKIRGEHSEHGNGTTGRSPSRIDCPRPIVLAPGRSMVAPSGDVDPIP